jgi:hypothetical protein
LLNVREKDMKKRYLFILISVFILVSCNSSILDDPSTTIQFAVPERSYVKLTVENNYNTLIATLVNREMSPGMYSVSFDGNDLAEGLYFYIIEMKGINNDYYYKKVRTMLLVK